MFRTVKAVIESTVQVPKKHISKFKTDFTFEQRSAEVDRIRSKYPDRVPVICERHVSNTTSPDIDKTKYLVPQDLTIGQFMYVIRKRLKLNASEALYLFANGHMMTCSNTVGVAYDNYKDSDGFLYLKYSKESTFG